MAELKNTLANVDELKIKASKTVGIMVIGTLLGVLYGLKFNKNVIVSGIVGAVSFYGLSRFIVKN